MKNSPYICQCHIYINIILLINVYTVDGEWAMWNVWGDCDSMCGGGEQSRTRECTGQDHGGDPCPGEAEEFMACNEHLCPGKLL